MADVVAPGCTSQRLLCRHTLRLLLLLAGFQETDSVCGLLGGDSRKDEDERESLEANTTSM
jgi:hypothetical protein